MSILSKDEEGVGEQNVKTERSKVKGRSISPQGSIQSFQDSGIGEGERSKAPQDEGCAISNTIPASELGKTVLSQSSKGPEQVLEDTRERGDIVKSQDSNGCTHPRNLDDTISSESDETSTEQRLAALLNNSHKDHQDPSARPVNLELQSKTRKGARGGENDDNDSVTSSDSDDSESFNKMLEQLSGDVPQRPTLSRQSSSTTPTTSNRDPDSLPSTPSPDTSYDPFIPLYSLHSSTAGSPDIHPSPIATYNLTFPENSVCYRGKVVCPGSPASAPARDQVCGVFSVDLCRMRSLRIFFSDDSCTSGQMVIASRESQYKILHFHHGGLDKMNEVFDHWKDCIKLHSKVRA